MSRRLAAAGRRLPSGGSYTALPTPFLGGRIDVDSLAQLCERQIGRGTAGLVAPIPYRMAS